MKYQKKQECMYCHNPITETAVSSYNCGCRSKPSPTYVSVELMLEHDKYKKALESIIHRMLHSESIDFDHKQAVKDVSEIAKKVF